MGLQINNQTEEQTTQEQTRQASLHKSVMSNLLDNSIQQDIVRDLGLSPEAKSKAPVKEEVVEEEQAQEEEPQEEAQEEAAETQEETEQEEEVIPKSKVQKRFDELTAQKKALERRIEELEQAKSTPKDEISKQLEAMTPEQLKAAKLEVRKLQIRSQDDDAKLNELMELEDKIDSVMQNAPKNFAKAQADAYARKAQQIAESGSIPDMEKAAPSILKLANEIYSEYPSLQKDINGQATALDLAVKHYKAINSAPGDKSKETELKRQVNNLKRKTTLDTKTGKSNIDKSKMDTLRKNAIGGTLRQKVDLVRSHPMFNVESMIPDELKER
jgi:hypothetical protein